MILFFHLICLFTHYIVNNLSKSLSKSKGTSNDESNSPNEMSSECQLTAPSSENGFIDKCRYDQGDLRFFPPVYVQRYEAVSLILQEPPWKDTIKKVVDFGCAELGFFMFLKNVPKVEEVLEVDIDEELLIRYASKAAPLTTDYLSSRRSAPFNVYLLAGSICDYDDRLKDTDAVVAIEVIEHLTDDVLKKMPYNIFHRIKPRLAIFTTPNAEFNVLFPTLLGFRHDDHKFEWTRKEFYDWAQKVVSTYPYYSVKFYGIGAGPQGTENLGCCSQMAVFERTDDISNCSNTELKEIQNYKLIREYKYPYHIDTRTVEEKILDETKYRLSQLSSHAQYYNYDEGTCEIPLDSIWEYVNELCSSKDEFRKIISNCGLNIKERNHKLVIIYSNESSDSEFSEEWHEQETIETVNTETPYEEENWDWDEGLNEKPSSEVWEDVPNNFSDVSQPIKSAVEANDKVDNEGNFQANAVSETPIFGKVNKISACRPETSKPGDRRIEISKIKRDLQSKIPRKRNFREVNRKKMSPLVSPNKHSSHLKSRVRPHSSHIRKSPRKISKSCSLDSCLENINCEPVEVQAFYLNLITNKAGTSTSASSLSTTQRNNSCKFLVNDSGSPIVDSSSFEKAVDSGYPFSFSPHDADLTPEQVDELVTENELLISKSSISEDSLSQDEEEEGDRIVHDVFVEDVIVENGDLANNNRDGEGNNVEGLAGVRLVNQIPLIAQVEPDPNDNNVIIIPEAHEEHFPDWLLNLVDLAQNPQNPGF